MAHEEKCPLEFTLLFMCWSEINDVLEVCFGGSINRQFQYHINCGKILLTCSIYPRFMIPCIFTAIFMHVLTFLYENNVLFSNLNCWILLVKFQTKAEQVPNVASEVFFR